MSVNPERLKLLEQYAKEDPKDPFPQYALALELAKADVRRAERLFDLLLTDHPDYLPTYYQASQLHITSGNPDRAKLILETGIEKTRAAGDMKALAELRSLLDEIN